MCLDKKEEGLNLIFFCLFLPFTPPPLHHHPTLLLGTPLLASLLGGGQMAAIPLNYSFEFWTLTG
jgi:hypothetical protein